MMRARGANADAGQPPLSTKIRPTPNQLVNNRNSGSEHFFAHKPVSKNYLAWPSLAKHAVNAIHWPPRLIAHATFIENVL